MTPFCVDTSAWIDAQLDHDPSLPFFEPFWSWLATKVREGRVIAAEDVIRELKDGRTKSPTAAAKVRSDSFWSWLQGIEAAIKVPVCPSIQARFRKIVRAYPQLVLKGKPDSKSDGDAWVIATAQERGACVVSSETPKPSAKELWKIPDVCADLGVQHVSFRDMVAGLHGDANDDESANDDDASD